MRFLLLTYFLLIFFSAVGQDTIMTIYDQQILAEVQEIKKYKILYLPYPPGADKSKSILKDEVDVINFSDGMSQYFQVVQAQLPATDSFTDVQDPVALYQQGLTDAEDYYSNPWAFWITYTSTVLPIAGIFTGGAMGGIIALAPVLPPRGQIPNNRLFEKSMDYAEGYKKAARKKRIKQIIKGFGYGIATQIVFIVLLVISA
ncbi:MAG: hypothetical protein AAF135_13900 [Bacteroidota bacterium]